MTYFVLRFAHVVISGFARHSGKALAITNDTIPFPPISADLLFGWHTSEEECVAHYIHHVYTDKYFALNCIWIDEVAGTGHGVEG